MFSFYGYDTGFFAYIGDMIRYGQIPYRDMWDHKAPLVYYLNALSFALFGSHTKTVAIVEMVWIGVTSVFFYKIAKIIFDKKLIFKATFLFTVFFASSYAAKEAGFTTLYLQTCTVISIFLILKYEIVRKRYLLFLSAIMASCAFLFKQPGATIMLPALFYIALDGFYKEKKVKPVVISASVWIAGFIFPIAAMAIYFAANNALADAISQMFTVNFMYSHTSLNVFKIHFGFLGGLQDAWAGGGFLLFTLILCGIIMFTLDTASELKKEKIKPLIRKHKFFLLALVWFFSDMFAISFSGRYYHHYYLQAVASMVILGIFSLKFIFKNTGKVAIYAVIILAFLPLRADFKKILSVFKQPTVTINGLKYKDFKREAPLIHWIQEHSNKDDYVLFWGAQTRFNFITQRKCPTKYNYMTPLKIRNYTKPEHLVRFLTEIQKNKPKIIVDSCNMGEIFCLHDRKFDIGNLAYTVFYINKNYEYVKTFESIIHHTESDLRKWNVYKLKENSTR
ncbi:MAG TPA: glycosyltransferase family 39 protein [Elusimicrobiales bacterium]|nr:glycosyltransferase family 39 protein [Elusimicrobiales bacterium]